MSLVDSICTNRIVRLGTTSSLFAREGSTSCLSSGKAMSRVLNACLVVGEHNGCVWKADSSYVFGACVIPLII